MESFRVVLPGTSESPKVLNANWTGWGGGFTEQEIEQDGW